MTMPYTFANGVGNYPDATKFNANFNYLEVLARRNRIINGNFLINQRQVTSVADDVYHLDRWYSLHESGNVTIAQVDGESGSIKNIKLTQPDASPKRIGIAQALEKNNIYDLYGSVATLTGRVRCSLSQPIRFAVVAVGADDTLNSDIVGNWLSSTFTESNFFASGAYPKAVGSITPSANTWTNFSLTVPDMGTWTNHVVFLWTEGTLIQNGTLEFARIALRQGAEAVHSETFNRSFAEELLLCQRYYEKSYDMATAPGTATTTGAIAFKAHTTGHIQGLPFKVQKRTAPVMTFYNPNSGASGTWRDVGGSTDKTATADLTGESNCRVTLTSSVDGNSMLGHYVASAEL